MAKIQIFKGYQGDQPVPKPAEIVRPNIVTVQDGVPVKYPGCEGIGVRVVQPANPKAPAKNLGLARIFHLKARHRKIAPHCATFTHRKNFLGEKYSSGNTLWTPGSN
jgi:hypothetical protein